MRAAKEQMWGFVSQGASSATNLLLSIASARLLGPSGFGVVFIGFAFYLGALAFQRALVTEPLVVLDSSQSDDRNDTGSNASALTSVFTLAIGFSAMSVALGLAIPGDAGRGILLFASVLVPALLHDFWRWTLFKDRRGRAAALIDAAGLVVMAIGITLISTRSPTPQAVVVAWGLASLTGALLGFLLTRTRPSSTPTAFRWLRMEAWALSRWLVLESVVYLVVTQTVIIALAGILGAAALGGLRAVQTVFAPMTLLAPAIALAALPELSRQWTTNPSQASRSAVRLGGLATALTLGYLVVVLTGSESILDFAFGDEFRSFSELLIPIGVGQLTAAMFIAYPNLLKAQQRTRALFLVAAASVPVLLVVTPILGLFYGIVGAAWGLTIASSWRGGLAVFVALRTRSSGRSTDGVAAPNEDRWK
jgi:O-antigen/teichoic acid export membrane protein